MDILAKYLNKTMEPDGCDASSVCHSGNHTLKEHVKMFSVASETKDRSKIVTLEAPGDCVMIIVLKSEQETWAATTSLSLSAEAANILAEQLQQWKNRDREVVPVGCKEYGG